MIEKVSLEPNFLSSGKAILKPKAPGKPSLNLNHPKSSYSCLNKENIYKNSERKKDN